MKHKSKLDFFEFSKTAAVTKLFRCLSFSSCSGTIFENIFSCFNQLLQRNRKNSWSARNRLIGLDISSTHIALAEISSGNNFSPNKSLSKNNDSDDKCCHYELTSFALIPIARPSYHCFDEDIIWQDGADLSDVVRQSIIQALAKSNPKTNNTVTALPYSMVDCRTILFKHQLLEGVQTNFQESTQESIQESAIEEFLKLNSEKYFGMDSAAINFDYRVLLPSVDAGIGAPVAARSLVSSDQELAVQVVATSKENISKLHGLVDRTRLNLIAVDVDVCALIRAAVFFHPELERPYVMIHLDTEKILIGIIREQDYQKKSEKLPFLIHEELIDEDAKINTTLLTQFILKQLLRVLETFQESDVFYGKNSNSYGSNGYIKIKNEAIKTITVLLCGINEHISVALADTITKIWQLHQLDRNINIKVIIANPFNQKIKLASYLKSRVDELNKIAPAMMLCCGLALYPRVYTRFCL